MSSAQSFKKNKSICTVDRVRNKQHSLQTNGMNRNITTRNLVLANKHLGFSQVRDDRSNEIMSPVEENSM
jgi:hypothetical protein